MAETAKPRRPRRDWQTRIWFLIFLAAIALTCVATWRVSGSLLDGDASSELVLAEHLADTHRILSKDWAYSTELRAVNTNLVYAPLFLLFDDYRMVRFFGALILQGLMVLAFWYLTRQAELRPRAFYLGAALLLLPVSVAYGRIALYHAYYLPHITLSFLIAGLLIGCVRERATRETRRMRALRIFLLCAVSFLSGLGGIRQLAVTCAPLMALLVAMVFRWDARHPEAGKPAADGAKRESGGAVSIGENAPEASALWRHRGALGLGLAAFACAFLGYLINDKILAARYQFMDLGGIAFGAFQLKNLKPLIYGYLQQFGFRLSAKSPFTLMGLLSLAGLFAAVYCPARAAWALIAEKRAEPLGAFVTKHFFLIGLVLITGVFLIAGGATHYSSYFIPMTVWIAPLLAAWANEKREGSLWNARRLIARALSAVVLIALFGNGLINWAYFAFPGRFEQPYEGLFYTNRALASELTGAVDFLEDEGYTLGYAPFWYANPVTELSDGKIRMLNLGESADKQRLISYDWLTLKTDRLLAPEKAFILISTREDEKFLSFPVAGTDDRVYSDEFFSVYQIDDPAALAEALKP